METRKFGAFATHPGEVLKDEIEYRGLSSQMLATEMGLSHPYFEDILNGLQPMSVQTAYIIESVMGISAELLLKLQLDYDMQTTLADKNFMSRLAGLRKIVAAL